MNCTEGMNCNSLSRDIKTQDAVIRNLEIIGEATYAQSPQPRCLLTNKG